MTSLNQWIGGKIYRKQKNRFNEKIYGFPDKIFPTNNPLIKNPPIKVGHEKHRSPDDKWPTRKQRRVHALTEGIGASKHGD